MCLAATCVPHRLFVVELAHANLRAARAEAALDHAFAAAFLLEAPGRVVYMNRSAEALISSARRRDASPQQNYRHQCLQQSKLKALIACAISACAGKRIRNLLGPSLSKGALAVARCSFAFCLFAST